jgi:hypothetical protein
MASHRYDNLTISARSTADESSVAFGVVIGEAFLPFHWMPTGGFEDDMASRNASIGHELAQAIQVEAV